MSAAGSAPPPGPRPRAPDPTRTVAGRRVPPGGPPPRPCGGGGEVEKGLSGEGEGVPGRGPGKGSLEGVPGRGPWKGSLEGVDGKSTRLNSSPW